MASRPTDYTYNNNMKNPVGSYRREFTLPANWDGRDIFVRFNGAGPGYYLWVNGQQVGYSEDSFLPSEFNITDYLISGTNVIAVQVYRFTSGSFLECQDFWRFSGIHRDVFLWSAGVSLAIPRFNILPEALAAEKPQASMTGRSTTSSPI